MDVGIVHFVASGPHKKVSVNQGLLAAGFDFGTVEKNFSAFPDASTRHAFYPFSLITWGHIHPVNWLFLTGEGCSLLLNSRAQISFPHFLRISFFFTLLLNSVKFKNVPTRRCSLIVP